MDPNGTVAAGPLHTAYREWCRRNDMRPFRKQHLPATIPMLFGCVKHSGHKRAGQKYEGLKKAEGSNEESKDEDDDNGEDERSSLQKPPKKKAK